VFGSGIATQDFPICDQYTIQGDVFSRAVRGDADVPVSLEDTQKHGGDRRHFPFWGFGQVGDTKSGVA
jgi:hypothetical protein